MNESATKPRVAVLGARETEMELVGELHRLSGVDLVGIYDPDPSAVGLPLAEGMGKDGA